MGTPRLWASFVGKGVLLAEIFMQLFYSLYTERVLPFQELQEGDAKGPYIESFTVNHLFLLCTDDQFRRGVSLGSDKLVGDFKSV
jgi:hypothetical protein